MKQDKKIICEKCCQEFTLTVKEQFYYFNKGYKEPVHCPECHHQWKRKFEEFLNS